MTFLVADDHPLFREALIRILGRLVPDARIFEAGNCREVRQLLSEVPDPTLLLLDLFMPCPEHPGIDFLSALSREYPDLPVVVLSASEEPEHMRQALDCGALGYVPKSLPTGVMTRAFELILAGGSYIPAALLNAAHAPAPREVVLTSRQRDVAALLRQGKSNKEIGRTLGLSPETVKVHVAAIFRALAVNNRTQAVVELDRLERL